MRRFKNVMITGPEHTQAPFAQFDDRTKRWRIWQQFNSDVTLGTFLDLYPDGSAESVTTHPDGGVEIVLITGPVS